MPEMKPDLDNSKPFRVRTVEGQVLHSQHKEQNQAEAAAVEANKRAEQLAIKARYEAHDETPTPES